MENKIDIHQLDAARKVLFVLNAAGRPLCIAEIKKELLALGISPEETMLKKFLAYGLSDARKMFIKDGLVFKEKRTYKIMQRGVEHLQMTVFVIDPNQETGTQKTLQSLFAGLAGDIKLCDPYFDEVACDMLARFLPHEKIRSIQVVCRGNKIDPTKNYKIGKHQIRLFKSKQKIHDRFLLDDANLYLLGASLNHIGGKVSFVFNLSTYKEMFEEMFQKLQN